MTLTLADKRGRHNPGAYLTRLRANANRRARLRQARPSFLASVLALVASLFVGAR